MKEFIKADVFSPIDFLHGGQFVAGEGWTHMKRNINLFVMIIAIHHDLYIHQDGTHYHVKPGDVLFLLPHRLHEGYKVSKLGTSYYWFHFNFSSPVSILSDQVIQQEITNIRSNPHTSPLKYNGTIILPVHSRPKYIERIRILSKQLLDVSKANYYNHYAVDYLATSLLIELSEQTITHANTSLEKSSPGKKLDAILEWIRIQALSHISVTMIAQEFNYNKDYLTRLFKKETGMTIQEYISILKLSKAKELLARTNESVKTVAFTIGMKDEKYFMRFFKKYEKMTPSEYRQAYYRTTMNNE
ncbi:AraC family transcriptional regulator [Salipaludibacillus sp. LMS25]|jgi:AraC-like DNA-binding protein|uniref:helix-turn-helix transcriptional regulator n=1 Tax=Salipaludibacillus sp. LMS25 TaxID=2924031 RepID=UPI0020D10C11|nr:AraC family transcriptional regulator [Salipaludibacillus sp. LMS25]UTR13720.1 AraC family transcriptional regulator [Salipaludibacillus sp. LMS25]